MLSVLLRKMKKDLHVAMKREIEMKKTDTDSGTIYEACISVKEMVRSVISMCPEIGSKPEKVTDEQTIQLIKRFIMMEKTRLLYTEKHLTEVMVKDLSASKLNVLTKNTITDLGDKLTSMKISIAQSYLPKTATISANDIKEWIKRNINFDDYKNKMQAMGPIMKHFKGADGNIVRKILEGYIKYD
jgi:hypothetical protein